jgi:hypothetical protein
VSRGRPADLRRVASLELKLASSTNYEWLHVSHQLRQRAVLAEAFSAGRISCSAVRAMPHMDDPEPETDAVLVTLAETGTAREVEVAVRHHDQIKDQERPPADPELSRCLRTRRLGDGRVRMELTVLEIGSDEVLAAVEAISAARRRSAREEDGVRRRERERGSPVQSTAAKVTGAVDLLHVKTTVGRMRPSGDSG